MMDKNEKISFLKQQQSPSNFSHPWLSEETKEIVNPILRFHNEIIDFVQYVSPFDQEHKLKMKIFEQITAETKNIEPSAEMISPLFSNKIYLKNSELQIFVMTGTDSKQWGTLTQKILNKCNIFPYTMSLEQVQTSGEMRSICRHGESGTQIWLTFVPLSWKTYLKEMEEIIVGVPELKYLFLLNWCMVRQRNLHTSIKSLFIFGLCSFFMFERRKQKSRTLAEGVIKFLQFFGVGSTYERQIKYKEGKSFEGSLNAEQRTFVFEIGEGVNLATLGMKDYFKVIQNRYRVIGNYFYVPGSSIVAHLVNPCSGDFFY